MENLRYLILLCFSFISICCQKLTKHPDAPLVPGTSSTNFSNASVQSEDSPISYQRPMKCTPSANAKLYGERKFSIPNYLRNPSNFILTKSIKFDTESCNEYDLSVLNRAIDVIGSRLLPCIKKNNSEISMKITAYLSEFESEVKCNQKWFEKSTSATEEEKRNRFRVAAFTDTDLRGSPIKLDHDTPSSLKASFPSFTEESLSQLLALTILHEALHQALNLKHSKDRCGYFVDSILGFEVVCKKDLDLGPLQNNTYYDKINWRSACKSFVSNQEPEPTTLCSRWKNPVDQAGMSCFDER